MFHYWSDPKIWKVKEFYYSYTTINIDSSSQVLENQSAVLFIKLNQSKLNLIKTPTDNEIWTCIRLILRINFLFPRYFLPGQQSIRKDGCARSGLLHGDHPDCRVHRHCRRDNHPARERQQGQSCGKQWEHRTSSGCWCFPGSRQVTASKLYLNLISKYDPSSRNHILFV